MNTSNVTFIKVDIENTFLVYLGLATYFVNFIVCTPFFFVIAWYELNAFCVHHRTMINHMVCSLSVLVST